MVQTIFTHPLFVETILPFLLVFTLVFAILQKTHILGKEKRQIDAIVALVIGLIFVAFGGATEIVVKMIPILAVSLVVILVFMLLLGFLFKPGEGWEMHIGIKWVIGILIGIVVVVTVLVLTGGLDYLLDFYYGDNTGILVNGILILIVAGAIAAVVIPGVKKKE